MKVGRESIIGFGLIIFCFVNYFYLIPSQVMEQGSKATYPIVINTFILISSIGYFIQSTYYYHRKAVLVKANKKNEISNKSSDKKFENQKRSIYIMFFVIIWVILLNYIGFLISTTIFLIGSISFCSDSRNYIKISTFSILFTIFIYFIFRILLRTMLPEGFLEILLENYF